MINGSVVQPAVVMFPVENVGTIPAEPVPAKAGFQAIVGEVEPPPPV